MVVRLLISLVVFAIMGAAAPSRSDEASDRGNSVTFLVGYGAGGIFDTYTRLLARHMGRHLPGRPVMFVENMVGGGGVVAANHLYSRVKTDGRTIGNWSGDLVLKQIFGGEQVQFDIRRFNWVGAVAPKHPVCVMTEASGINAFEDWSKARRPIRLGGIGETGTTPKTAAVLADALGLPIKLVEGYQGTVKVRLAAQTHELDGGCWDWQAIKKGWAEMLQRGEAKIVLQAMSRVHADLAGVPNAIDLAVTREAKLLIEHGVHDPATIARFYSLPPGTPEEKVALIREAFARTVRDPLFLAEAKSMGLEVDPVDGARIERTVKGLFELDPKLKVKLRRVLFPRSPEGTARVTP